MDALWELFESENVFALMFLALLLNWVGQAMAGQHETIRHWSHGIAGASFWLYASLRLASDGWADPFVLCGIVIRGLLVAAMFLGLTLIVLAPIVLIRRKTADGWLEMTNRVKRWCSRIAASNRAVREQVADRRRQQEWNATAPERERQQREASQRAQEESKRTAETQQRREATHLACQLLYDRHATALRDLLPRERFDALLAMSLTNTVAFDVAEQRATQIQQLIHELVTDVSRGRQQFRDLFAIANHFHERRRQLDQLSYDENTKSALKAALTLQEEASIQEFLKT